MANLKSKQLDPEFWREKRVLLTGHTGFKGSWMAFWLASMQAEVIGFSLPPHTEPNLFNALQLSAEEQISQNYGDIRDKKHLQNVIRESEPDIIMHFAAQPIVSEGYVNPLSTFETNVMGVANLLDACRNIAREIPMLIISSDKCYLNNDNGRRFSVGAPLGGKDPYSASKAGTEIVASAYAQSYFNRDGLPRLATARAGNVIGGGDWSDNRLIPDSARTFSNKNTLEIRNPLATRPWQHVLEPLYGYLILTQAIAEDQKYAKPWNFGPNSNSVRTVNDVIQIFSNAWGPKCAFKISNNEQDWKEAVTLDLDCSETNEILGWHPVLDLESALLWTADWYKSFYQDRSISNIRDITSRQIKKYVDLQNKYS
jgi:CDP-glucose 4,6-dehydratase